MSNIQAYVQDHYAKAVSQSLGSWLMRNSLPCYVEPKFDERRVLFFWSRGKGVYATKHNGTYTVKTHLELFSILHDHINADGRDLRTQVNAREASKLPLFNEIARGYRYQKLMSNVRGMERYARLLRQPSRLAPSV